MQVNQVSPHVYMVSGLDKDVNSSFVSTGNGIIIFDTGSSISDGCLLREKIAEISDEPILYVVNSHGHGNHCGGNGAFSDSLFLVHRLNKTFASASLFKEADYSTITFSKDCSLCVGGMFIEFRLFQGHVAGSLVMVVPDDNVVITGDMLLTNGLPSVSNSSLQKWAEELEFLESFDTAVFIPGHGPVADCSAVKQQRVYIESLIDTTSSMKRDGLGIDEVEALTLVELPYVAEYLGKHRENLRTAFLQVA